MLKIDMVEKEFQKLKSI